MFNEHQPSNRHHLREDLRPKQMTVGSVLWMIQLKFPKSSLKLMCLFLQCQLSDLAFQHGFQTNFRIALEKH